MPAGVIWLLAQANPVVFHVDQFNICCNDLPGLPPCNDAALRAQRVFHVKRRCAKVGRTQVALRPPTVFHVDQIGPIRL